MSQNVELKAYYPDLGKGEELALEIGAKLIGTDQQIDTYFKTTSGRFKLRESTLSAPYLVPYLREKQKGAKISNYEKIPVENAVSVKNIFENILGIELVVSKKRTIYLYENVRIHLDEVNGSGTFIEFEAVMDAQHNDEMIEKEKILFLMKTFGIDEKTTIADSYYDMQKETDEKS